MAEEKVTDLEPDIHEEVVTFLSKTSRSKEPPQFPSLQAGRIYYTFRAHPRTPLDALELTMTELSRHASIAEELSSVKAAHELRMLASSVEHMKRELSSCKEKIDSLHRMLEERPIVRHTKIFDLGCGLHVVEAIPVVIEETEDEVIASFPEIEVFGVADTESEALLKLKKNIVDLYYDLINTTQDELGELPLSWLRVLKRILIHNGNA